MKLTLWFGCQVEWVLCRLRLYLISSWGHLGVRVLGWMFWALLVLICEDLILEQQSDVLDCEYLIRTNIEWFEQGWMMIAQRWKDVLLVLLRRGGFQLGNVEHTVFERFLSHSQHIERALVVRVLGKCWGVSSIVELLVVQFG